MKAAMTSPRIEEYREVLKSDPVLATVTDRCLKVSDDPADQMYLVLWAPTLVCYVLWVLHEAVQDGQKRLYFLSRDAYPMYLVARELVTCLNIDLEIRYLRVSRYSLRIPEYHLMGIECLERIFLSGIDVSMYRILNRAGLTEAQMNVICKEIGYDKPLHQNINRKEICRWKGRVKCCCENGTTGLLNRIYEISEAAYTNTVGYLEQEGLLDNIRYAVVDSGWVGTIQQSMHRLLTVKKPDLTISGYYFGLYECPLDKSQCVYKAYYFMPKGSVWRKSRFSNCLYEVMYSEPCSMVKGYESDDNTYRPVFSEIGSPNVEILQRNRDLLVIYIKTLIQELGAQQVTWGERLAVGSAMMVEKMYSKLMAAPNRWEAAYYGSQQFSDDISDAHLRCIANRLSQREIRDLRSMSKLMIALGWSHRVIHESGWIEGTIVNAGQHIRSNLRAARRAKYLTHLRQSLRAE